MLGSLYKSIFGEFLKSQERLTTMASNSYMEPNSVSDKIKNYDSLNDKHKLDFLDEINR
jgi:hypothetical protein